MREQVQLPRERLGVFDKTALLVFQIDPRPALFRKIAAQFFSTGEGIEHAHLLLAGEETLVVVGAVEINKSDAQLAQQGECAGRPVHKLLSRAFGQHGAFDNQRPVFARLRAAGFENGVNRRSLGNLEKPFHRAGVGSVANESAVGAFAEQELHRAEDDGFSRSGFACDGDKPAGRFPKEIFHQGEVADAQRCQRCGHRGTMPRSPADSKRCRNFKSHFSARAHRMASR